MSDSQEEQVMPELSGTILDTGEVDALFGDLKALTRVHGILLKRAPQNYVPESQGAVTLDEAKELLLRREVRGIQVRYTWQGKEYWDTMMSQPDGVRVVRICHE